MTDFNSENASSIALAHEADKKSSSARLKGSIDFQDIKERALENIDLVLEAWLPEGQKKGKRYLSRNPMREDNEEGSFSIDMEKGFWGDFAIGKTGGDLISLVAYLEDCDQGQAASKLDIFLIENIGRVAPSNTKSKTRAPKGKPDSEWTPIVPVPSGALPLPTNFGKLGKPTGTWEYKDSSGGTACFQLRFDPAPGSKSFTSLTYCQNASGQKEWKWQGLTSPKPLYHLPEILSNPKSPVLVCEGEKAADAAQKLFPGWVTTTSMNGAKSPGKTNWGPLKGHQVYIWRDNDDAGIQYADAVVDLIRQHDPQAKISIINMSELERGFDESGKPNLEPGRELPKGWDAADAVTDGWTAERIGLIGDKLWVPVKNAVQIKEIELPAGYQIAKGKLGVVKLKDDEPIFYAISSPLYVTALTRDENNGNWGRLLEFEDPDGNSHSWAMPQDMLSGNGDGYRAVLLNMGLTIIPQASKQLGEYISECTPKYRALCVSQIGWHGKVFVLPDATYGESTERVILQTTERATHTYGQKGTLEDWKANVSTLCVGNSRLTLAVSAAFAAPILHFLDEESGGIHFRGESSKGKTKILKVASSVWGGSNNMQRWKATGNGLEAVAQNYNNTLLCLDELAQVSPKEAGEVAYMLANGAGKQRASRCGGAKERSTWRLLFLSAGEIGLAEHMAQDGQLVRAGQEVRMADVPVDAGAGFGAFENLHGQVDGSRFANKLTEVANLSYGTAGRAFVDWLTKVTDVAGFVDRLNKDIQQFMEAHIDPKADGQVFRVGRRFGLIAVAGEAAVQAGVVAWEAGAPTAAAARCLKDWIDARQGTGSQEEVAIISQVRRFFEQHGDSRFTPMEDVNSICGTERPTINRAGFRKSVGENEDRQTEFYVLPETYNNEICKGFDSRLVTKVLKANNFLELGTAGKSQVTKRLPTLGLVKVYVIKPEIFGQ